MTRKKRTRAGAAPATVRSPRPQTTAAALRWYRPPLVVAATAVLLLGIGVLLYALFGQPSDLLSMRSWWRDSAPVSNYVGAKACAACHAEEYDAWRGSEHALAMQHADAQSVQADFENSEFTYAGITSTFFKREERFYVNTDGPDGKLRDYEIKYTFGVTPLQQYLIEMPGGRYQALSIAWDSRPKELGGRRWFHLYPKDRITHDDELHWTRPAHNWNFMCADCHSTDLRKNYNPTTDSFKTQWAEISVGCEACHGPGSRHVSWAKTNSPPLTKGEDIHRNEANKGLTVSFNERRGVAWNQNAATGNAARSQPRASDREIEVCAQCHARRGQIAEGYAPGKLFLDHYRPALLSSPLYHADGQQRDEVYIWGSFLQSKMYASGVTCSDCHNPHSGKLRAEGNTICASCHQNTKYDTPAHHHHKSNSAGAACVACHMPATTYMVVDPRHDHSLRVPRPDLSVQLGTPNACNGCHKDGDAAWASTEVRRWYGRDAHGYQRFAGGFAATSAGVADASAQLRAIAAEGSHPPIARATALAQLDGALGNASTDVIAAGARDRNPLLRLAALQSLAAVPPEARVRWAAPLLSDPLRAIRIEAASVLAPIPADQLNPQQRAAFEGAAEEFIASQRYNADRADARVNLGTFYANRGDAAKAEEEMKTAIALDRFFIPAHVNLSDLYRVQGRDAEGERILRDALKIAPENASLHHALGLTLVRLKRADAALGELEQATLLDPANARFSYVYAVALHSTGKVDAAIKRLETSLTVWPDNREVLEALVSFHDQRGDRAAATRYAEKLRKLPDK